MQDDAGEILESRNDQVRSETGGVCEMLEFQNLPDLPKLSDLPDPGIPGFPGFSDLPL